MEILVISIPTTTRIGGNNLICTHSLLLFQSKIAFTAANEDAMLHRSCSW